MLFRPFWDSSGAKLSPLKVDSPGDVGPQIFVKKEFSTKKEMGEMVSDKLMTLLKIII